MRCPSVHVDLARRSRIVRLLALLSAVVVMSFGLAAPAQAATKATPVSVRLISFNDFHGNLQPPAGSSGRVTLANGTMVEAGGAAFLATHLKQLRAEVRNSVALSTGDNIGASPLPSALFHDEPTIAFLNQLGLSASVVGNHEFDEGYKELLRMQLGGCNPTDGCQFRPTYKGANFPFLGANVVKTNGLPAALPFTIKISGGVPIGIIGVTLEDLPTVVIPTAVQGLRFTDEVKAINTTSTLLHKLGIESQVVIMHQGDEPGIGATGPNSCTIAPDGLATAIATNASARVDAFFTAHTHQQYNCSVNDPAGNPRPMIQGLSFGRLLSVVDLKIDPKTRDVIRTATVARNEVVTRTVTPDAAVQTIVDEAATKSAPIANRPVGTITADIVRATAVSGESPLGNVLTDAQLESTAGNGAVIAMTNPGGVRTDLTYAGSPAGEGDGVVTYGEAFNVQPFGNILQTITLTGAQLDAVLEQQWQPTVTRILQVSKGFSYDWSTSAAAGSKVSNLRLNGTPIDPSASYRVTVNNFLSAGGDGFTAFTGGTNLTGGAIDLDAFAAYLTTHPNLAPPATDRITVLP